MKAGASEIFIEGVGEGQRGLRATGVSAERGLRGTGVSAERELRATGVSALPWRCLIPLDFGDQDRRYVPPPVSSLTGSLC